MEPVMGCSCLSDILIYKMYYVTRDILPESPVNTRLRHEGFLTRTSLQVQDLNNILLHMMQLSGKKYKLTLTIFIIETNFLFRTRSK